MYSYIVSTNNEKLFQQYINIIILDKSMQISVYFYNIKLFKYKIQKNSLVKQNIFIYSYFILKSPIKLKLFHIFLITLIIIGIVIKTKYCKITKRTFTKRRRFDFSNIVIVIIYYDL